MRTFKLFKYKDASYRISVRRAGSESEQEFEDVFHSITDNIIAVRTDIENYINRQPEFLSSMCPVEIMSGAPKPVSMMAKAAKKTGIGPMAAVAGTIAQCAAERSAEAVSAFGFNEIIIENGGDIYINLIRTVGITETDPVIAGIFSGLDSVFSNLALKITADKLPLSICSSSGRMGHSLSLGDCDLATVISKDAALADAAATLGGNLVKNESDIGPTSERIAAIDGIEGIILIKNAKIAMAGSLPELIKHIDANASNKITKTIKIE